MLRKTCTVALCGASLSTAWYHLALSPEEQRKLRYQADSVYRAANVGAVGVVIAADYKLHSLRAQWNNTPSDSDEYKDSLGVVHQRNADRLVYICKNHGGMYAKFGQYVSTLNHLLPQQYTQTLAVLQTDAKPRPWEEIEEQLERELGSPVSQMFQSFDKQSVGAASVAQVHRAVTHDGQEVAVKVQYPGLEHSIGGDWWLIRTAARLIGKVFPDFEYSWMAPEFENNMRLELDFQAEARNAEMLAKALKQRTDAYVPAIRHDLSTKRVLTMEFVHGSHVSDIASLKSQNMDLIHVADTISTVFGEMVFCYGIVHCDPHPGNLMVRKKADGSPQVVILDHGMYRQLTPRFRLTYCRLWQAFITQDQGILEEAGNELGVGEYIKSMPHLFTFKMHPQEQKTATTNSSAPLPIARKFSPQDVRGSVLAGVVDLARGELVGFHVSLVCPDEQFRSQFAQGHVFRVALHEFGLRSVSLALGGSSLQRFRINAACALKGLQARYDPSVMLEAVTPYNIDERLSSIMPAEGDAIVENKSLKGRAADGLKLMNLKVRVWLIQRASSAVDWWTGARKKSSSTTVAASADAKPPHQQ